MNKIKAWMDVLISRLRSGYYEPEEIPGVIRDLRYWRKRYKQEAAK